MSFVSDTLGPMLQGVSQQPERIRLAGQVSEQQNMISNVSTGLTTRSGSMDTGVISTDVLADYAFSDVEFNGKQYLMAHKAGDLKIWDSTGTSYGVNWNAPTGLTPAFIQNYFGTNMRFHVIDGKILALNRDIVVRHDPASALGSPRYAGYADIRGTAFSKRFQLTVILPAQGSGPRVERAYAYTTPDGTTAGDAAKATPEYITTVLRDQINADGWITDQGVAAAARYGILVVHGYTRPIVLAGDDNAGNSFMKVADGTTDKVEDLPRSALRSTETLVTGESTTDDDYYLTFIHDDDSAGNQPSLGDAGYWKETVKRNEPLKLLDYTMPMTLQESGGTFTVSVTDWAGRVVGDLNTNPFPSFLDHTIRDLQTFEDRLVFCSGENVVMSRSGEPFNFFRKSAAVLVPDDRIDIRTSAENSVSLDWMIPFDNDLVILSDPGDGQYIIEGGSGITPQTATMTLTTSYRMEGFARPAVTGRTMIFPFGVGSYSGLKEFFTHDSVTTNGADTITENVDRYITGNVTNLTAMNNQNMLFVQTDDPEMKTVWTYRYLWDGTERLQSAWSKWQFNDKVRHIMVENSLCRVVLEDELEGTLHLVEMNLTKPPMYFGNNLPLDRVREYTVQSDAGGSYIELPYDNPALVQYTGCPDPGRYIDPTIIDRGTHFEIRMPSDECPAGALIVVGARIISSVKPTMPRILDRNGATVSNAQITINHFTVHLEDSGLIQGIKRNPRRYDNYQVMVREIYNGELDRRTRVPWRDKARDTELEIISSSGTGITILEIEWEGQVVGRKGR